MALKEPFMVKNAYEATGTTLELKAETDESILVKQVRVGATESEGFANILIDRMSCGYWYTGDINANHLEQWSITSMPPSLFMSLVRKGIIKGYPLASGQKMTVKLSGGSNIKAGLIYQQHDAGDITEDMQNGTEADELVFVNYGTNSSDISSSTTGKLDKSRNPSEYPAFPFGDVVPSNYRIEILGALIMSWRTNSNAGDTANPEYQYLKLVKDRDVLFDNDRKGIHILEGMGLLTWGPCRQTGATDVELFPEPIVCEPGEEMNVFLTAGSKNLVADDVNMGFIERLTRV